MIAVIYMDVIKKLVTLEHFAKFVGKNSMLRSL